MKTILTPVLTLTLVTLISSGCSDNSTNTNTILDDSDLSLRTVSARLKTEVGQGFHEAWICIDTAGEVYAYTFYGRGDVDNGLEELQLGTEYSVISDRENFDYAWQEIDNTSIVLQSPPLGLQDVWTNMEFSPPNEPRQLMRAISGAKGQLSCSLEGEEK